MNLRLDESDAAVSSRGVAAVVVVAHAVEPAVAALQTETPLPAGTAFG